MVLLVRRGRRATKVKMDLPGLRGLLDLRERLARLAQPELRAKLDLRVLPATKASRVRMDLQATKALLELREIRERLERTVQSEHQV
jgi:hypothetical protein